MSIIDSVISFIAPHACLVCENEGALLCAGCKSTLTVVPSRCYRCRRLTTEGRTCPACRKRSALYAVRVAVVYEGVAKDLVWKLKYAGTQAAAREMAHLMECRSPLLPTLATVVPVPTATSRARRRGYDQATLIARAFARRARIPFVVSLARHGQAHQVGANRRQRLTQLESAFRVLNPSNIVGAHIILVDDVVTTGATLEAAAKVLRLAGARRVDAVVFAQP